MVNLMVQTKLFSDLYFSKIFLFKRRNYRFCYYCLYFSFRIILYVIAYVPWCNQENVI